MFSWEFKTIFNRSNITVCTAHGTFYLQSSSTCIIDQTQISTNTLPTHFNQIWYKYVLRSNAWYAVFYFFVNMAQKLTCSVCGHEAASIHNFQMCYSFWLKKCILTINISFWHRQSSTENVCYSFTTNNHAQPLIIAWLNRIKKRYNF
jgi:hypothetical protein